MKNNRIILIPGILIALLVGLVLGCFIPVWCNIQPNFFNVRIIEIGQLILPILIAVFVSYLISRGITYDLKYREIILEILSKLQTNLSEVLEVGYDYMRKPNSDKQKKILRQLKNISMMVGLLKELKRQKRNIQIYDSTLSSAFLGFKIALTDSPFGETSPVYDTSREGMIQEKFDVTVKKIYEFKLRVFE